MDTPARLLRLLALLSSRATWRGDELAIRLAVTERSIRRDVTRLRGLGYPIESVTGPYGGYALGAGGRLPPLLLDDDEAVSMAVALHEIAQRSSPTIAEGALSALTKLGQVLPLSLRERVGALTEVVVDVSSAHDRAGPGDASSGEGNAETLMTLALTCARNERIRFDYRTGEGVESGRHVEPFRLVSARRRWYFVAFDLDRADWRTFRVDRIGRVRPTTARFVRTEEPDAAQLVASGLAVNAYDVRATVRVFLPPERAMRAIPPTVGVVHADPANTTAALVEIGGDLDWTTRYLAGSEFRFEVVEPPALRDELRALGERLVTENG